jgi:signal transduction histidine kinase/ligand-binding sensor domain-containing protein/CheY-like chemotaxis protein
VLTQHIRSVMAAIGMHLVLMPGNVWALDPAKTLDEFRYKAWEEAEGLPHYSINGIVQGSEGYLWLATYYGVVRFDGEQFKVYDRQNTPAFKSNQIWCLEKDAGGTLWAGTALGLLSFSGGEWKAAAAETLSGDSIRSLRRAPNGDLWGGTTKRGAFLLRKGQVTWLGPAGQAVRALLADALGNLWIGTNAGLFRWNDGRMDRFGTKDGLPSDHVLSLEQGRGGVLYVGTVAGMASMEGGDAYAIRKEPQLAGEVVWAIQEDRDGVLWIGTLGGGLVRRNKGRIERFHNPGKAASMAISALYEDREGNVWFGASGGGLGRLTDVAFYTLTTGDGLGGNLVQCVLTARDGTLWVGLNGGGLTHLSSKGRPIRTFRMTDGLASNDVWSLHEDRAGNIWAGAYNGKLMRVGREGIRNFGERDGIPVHPIVSVSEDRQGAIWIGTLNGGLSVVRNGQTRAYSTFDGLSSNQVRVIYEDSKGRQLLGTNKGLSILENGKFTNYTSKDGLTGDFVYSILEEPAGTFWIGTFDGGLTRMRDGKFVRFAAKAGFPTETVFRILDDRIGSFWVSSSTGIFRLSKKNLNDYADGRVTKIEATSYGISEGLLSRECNGGQPAGDMTPDGRLWFPTMKGLAVVDPRHLPQNTLPPPVMVERVRADGRDQESGSPIKVAAGSRTLQIYYTGLSLTAPDKVRFRYRLMPFEEDWVEAGPRRVAVYTNLPRRRYTFQVIASNNDGVWNNTGASVDVRLLPYFYQTPVFVLLCVAALAGLVWMIHSLRLRALRRLNQGLEQRVAERTHSLEVNNRDMTELIVKLEVARKQAEEASRVRSEFVANVSHEIRTPLNGILGLVGLIRATQLSPQQEEYLRLTAQSADSLMYVLNDVLDFSKMDAGHLTIDARPFSPRLTIEDSIKLLSPHATEKGLKLIGEFAPGFPDTVIGDHLRLRQVILNLIGNAVKFTASGGVVVRANFSDADSDNLVLSFRVEDTGIGVSPDKQALIFEPFRQADSSTTRKYGGTGLGLAISSRLVEAMEGQIGVDSVDGEGSTFYFTVTVGRMPLSAQTVRAPAHTMAGRTVPLRVLLAEDNVINQKVATSLLQKFGCEVEVVANGRLAVARVCDRNYDLVLMDIQMPEMDGLSSIAEIRAMERETGGHTLVFALTARTMEGDAENCIAAGMDGYLSKPIDPHQLFAILERLMPQQPLNSKQTG